MTSLFVCYEHKLYKKNKKKFTSVINEQVFVTIHPAKKINSTDLSAAATKGTMQHAP